MTYRAVGLRKVQNLGGGGVKVCSIGWGGGGTSMYNLVGGGLSQNIGGKGCALSIKVGGWVKVRIHLGGGVIFFKSMGGWGSLCDMLGGGI